MGVVHFCQLLFDNFIDTKYDGFFYMTELRMNGIILLITFISFGICLLISTFGILHGLFTDDYEKYERLVGIGVKCALCTGGLFLLIVYLG